MTPPGGFGANLPGNGFSNNIAAGNKRQQLMMLQQQRRLALLRQLQRSLKYPTKIALFTIKCESYYFCKFS